MATVQSIQMKTPGRYPVSGPGIGGRSIKVERGEYNTATQGVLAVADVVQLFKLHPRFRVTGGWIKTTGLGTGVTATVGDAGDAARYFASADLSAAAVVTELAPGGLDFLNGGAFTTVNLTVAGATTAATGSVVVELHGYIEEPA